ncbi:glycogen synthase GlgA [Paraclostridium bifermentans]|uniref:glycogen synthase GlgA n=2 Tax=Paraclostridium bifermentans TaxID=1490 RepID=UPI0021C3575D|nr:glycogen synthase GlgA [Paraclostridium bifermentans]GKZ02546.1 glycogen synthase [Paraclostridium bifermentans]GKZ05606.1 glycogen synthase [Paraclostridium bifermentans]
MRVLFVTAECWPFVKTGGLGDVSYALPKALKREGVDIRVIMPKYVNIPKYLKDQMKTVAVFNVNVAWRNQYCGLMELELDGVKFYFIDNEFYFKRDGEYAYLYGYDDDVERFTFFSNAVLESLKRIDFFPDVINLNDWHTGMIPLFLKENYSQDERYSEIKTIYTIHNLQYQGVFSNKNIEDVLSIPRHYLDDGHIEYYGGINFMKSGIVYSDKVSTVSPTYANEIQTKFYGESLDGLIKSNSHKLKGIVNGIDYEINNPETDKNIVCNYNINSIGDKVKNKLELQKILGLEVNPDIPMIGIVSRLVSQKGLDLISYMMPEIVGENLQLVVLGTGEEQYQSMLNYYLGKYPNKVAAILTFDAALAQQIYASSDMFLMPSLFEPCGIGQMIAMRYGSIPIVRETGGLKDTVKPFNKYTGEGNGFSFANYNAHEMFYCIKSAIDIYKNDKKSWFKIVKSAMSTDSSWAKSANEYIKTYNEIVWQRSW